MKSNGLQNRFASSVRYQWSFWYSCMVCGKNGFDALHHIVSPVHRHYVPGEHNRSVFNSCPIHNLGCHIGRDGFLHRPETMARLLKEVLDALDFLCYKPKSLDQDYFQAYGHLYSETSRTDVKLRYGWGYRRNPK